jgi:hypothetical protein
VKAIPAHRVYLDESHASWTHRKTAGLSPTHESHDGWWGREVCPVVAPLSHRARRVKVGASCGANLDAPARDARLICQRRPRWASGESRNAVMLKQPNVLLVEVPPQFIALCETTGVSPQAALRGMAAMVCGLRYDADDRLVPLEGEAA